jgi:NADH:ubiquinone oxidoreductase subunit 2 (subunit N)
MISLDFIYLLGFISSVIIFVFAIKARCWVLAAGYILQLPVGLQVLWRKLVRIIGYPKEEVPSWAASLNRTLSIGAIILVTLGLVQVLNRYSRLRATSVSASPQPK